MNMCWPMALETRPGNNGGSWEPPSQKENKVGRKFLGLYHAILL